MRDEIKRALEAAVASGDQRRISTLRLIQEAVKDKDIAARAEDRCTGAAEGEICCILNKMVKLRERNAAKYEDNGRFDLAEQERSEIEIIESFLPRQLTQQQIELACEGVLREVKATGLRDMGKCMGALQQKYEGRMDFTKASSFVKSRLSTSCRALATSHR